MLKIIMKFWKNTNFQAYKVNIYPYFQWALKHAYAQKALNIWLKIRYIFLYLLFLSHLFSTNGRFSKKKCFVFLFFFVFFPG